ncbi:MAG: L,D-transpeptidase [Patescibacteria group bacterium]
MPKRIKAGKEGRGNGMFYFAILLICLVAVLFLAFKTFAGELILDADIEKIEEVGQSEQVKIGFNRPVASMSLENIEIDPFIGFSYELSDNRQTLTIIPNSNFTLQQKYSITLKNIRGVSGFPLGNKELAFYTEKKEKSLAQADSYTKGEHFAELTLAKNKYVAPAVSAVKQPVRTEPHFLEGKYIDVSISRQLMTIFENGVQVNQFKVSTGKVGMATPLGEYKVLRKETNHWSVKYKLWMPYSMNFTGGYYIHELPYWPNGYREGESHLGRRVSHGCVRLGIGPAKYVFDWADIGTPIYIHQ